MLNKPRAEGMTFEKTMTIFLGEKAHGIACIANNTIERNKTFSDVINIIYKKVDSLDTTPRHKQLIFNSLDSLKTSFKKQNEFDAICGLFSLIAKLLGIIYEGYNCFSPIYVQNENQHLTEKIIFKEEDEFENNKKNAITKRSELVKQLKNENFNSFYIALILNQSENYIKTLSKVPMK